MINRVPSGQAEGSTRSASSTTHAPSRMLPSVSIAWRQSSSWTSSRASRIRPSSGQPVDRLVEQLEVVVCVIRLGVPRTEHGGQGLVRRFAPHPGRRRCPHLRPSRSHRRGDRSEPGGCRGSYRSPGRDDRGDRTEQLVVLTQGRQVGQAAGTVRHGDCRVGEHHTAIVSVPRDSTLRHGQRHRLGQATAIRQFGQQRGAPVGQ